MNINELAQTHYQWVEKMNWHNKTTLESLALIASEIGECAYEYMDDKATSNFGEELADIMLRVLDLGHLNNVDLNKEINNSTVNWRYKDIPKMFMQIFYEFGELTNTARKETLGDNFHQSLGLFSKHVIEFAIFNKIDLEKEILLKININKQRGTRGRII